MNKEFLKDAKAYALSRGFSRIADDFAAEAALAAVSGRTVFFKTFLIDYMRANFGDSRHPNSIAHKIEYRDELPEVSQPAVAEGGVEWEFLLDMVEKKDRPLLVMQYHWGLSQKELAYALGVTEGAITQRMTRIMRDLRGKLEVA